MSLNRQNVRNKISKNTKKKIENCTTIKRKKHGKHHKKTKTSGIQQKKSNSKNPQIEISKKTRNRGAFPQTH